MILPSILAGFLMSFTLSIDDFVITFFVAGVGVTTLPLQIYSMIKVAVSPEVNAVSTLLMALTLTLIALAARLAPDALKGGMEGCAPLLRPAARAAAASPGDAGARRRCPLSLHLEQLPLGRHG